MASRHHTNLTLLLAFALVVPADAFAQTTPTPSESGTRVVVPGGTFVPIVVADKISSASANVGDTFSIQASDDVVVNGWIVIAKGAPGQGEILSVDRAGSHGHGGSLGIQYDWIFAADGNKIKLTNQRSTEEGQGEAGVSSTMTILSYALLGPLGLFAHNFVKGHDVEVDSSHALKAYVGDSVYVVAINRGESAGFAPSVSGGVAPRATAGPSLPTSSTSASSATTSQVARAAPSAFAPAVVGSPAASASAPTQGSASATVPMEASTVSSTTEGNMSLIDMQGTQPKTSDRFTAPGTWGLEYAFDCSASPTGTPKGFSLAVNGASPTIRPIIQGGTNGTDVVQMHQAGTFTLHVESHCVWHVRAFGAH